MVYHQAHLTDFQSHLTDTNMSRPIQKDDTIVFPMKPEGEDLKIVTVHWSQGGTDYDKPYYAITAKNLSGMLGLTNILNDPLEMFCFSRRRRRCSLRSGGLPE